jgi:hypothetical protein
MRVKQIRATYSRLSDQSWGIRITGATVEDVPTGWVISVSKKDGTLKEETIGQIVSTSKDATGLIIFARVANSASKTAPKEEEF